MSHRTSKTIVPLLYYDEQSTVLTRRYTIFTDEDHVDVPCADGRTLLGSSCAPGSVHDDVGNTVVWLVFSPVGVSSSSAPTLYDTSHLRSVEVISDSLASW